MAENGKRKHYRVGRHRVDIVLPGADGDQKVMIYANSGASASLLQSWIYKMLECQTYRIARYNLVEMEYLLDPKSVYEVNATDAQYANFSKYRQEKSAGKLELTVRKDNLHGGDVHLTFYAATRDDLSVFALYLKSGLAGSSNTIQCYVKYGGKWEPWVEGVFLRKDLAEIMFGLSLDYAGQMAEFAKRLKDGEKLCVLTQAEYEALKGQSAESSPEGSGAESQETGESVGNEVEVESAEVGTEAENPV